MIESIGWGNLPNIPHLMVEFVSGRAAIVALLGGDWRAADTRLAAAERRAGFNREPGLSTAIRSCYGDLEITPAVERNIEALNQPDTLAVVTGQQVGIFGGPLYTFYKALTTILLAERLEAETNRRVVPVFWMETADADFAEVNRISFQFMDNDPRILVYVPKDILTGRSINFHELTPEIDIVQNEIQSWLANLPHGGVIGEAVQKAYHVGKSLPVAFQELLSGQLGSMGLVILNPLHPAIVERTSEFWDRCLIHPDKLNKSFIIASGEISKLHFPLQVKLREDALPILHLDENGVRRRIRGQPDRWETGETNGLFNDSELRRYASENPARFTPSALLRPVLQDWLLPTWIYVGGAAEVAYHAQIGTCYDLLEIPRPLIAPRISASLIEPAARRLLGRNGWTVKDVVGGREILLRSSGKPAMLADLADRGLEQLDGWLERIERSAEEASININLELDRAGRKLKFQWNKLGRIILYKLAERDRTRLSHAERLLNLIMPEGMLQERHDSPLYFLAIYGDKLVQSLSSEAELFNTQHIVVDLEAV